MGPLVRVGLSDVDDASPQGHPRHIPQTGDAMTTTRMTLRLPVELHSHLVRLAQENDRTLTAEVTRAIRLYVSDQAAAALPHQASPSPPPDPTPAGSAPRRLLPRHARPHPQLIARSSGRRPPLETLAYDSSRSTRPGFPGPRPSTVSWQRLDLYCSGPRFCPRCWRDSAP